MSTNTNAQNEARQSTSKGVRNGFEKNQNKLIGAIVLVALIVGGFFGYRELIGKPNEEKALSSLNHIQKWFEVDSFNYVIDGDGQNSGGLNLIKKFSGTKAENLTQYYVGVAYLKKGQFQEAIDHLVKFNGHNLVFKYLADGLVGDAHLELNQNAKAIEYYKKASSGSQNDNFTTPYYLFKLGLVYDIEGNVEEAKNAMLNIKTNFPASTQAREVDRYLGKYGSITN